MNYSPLFILGVGLLSFLCGFVFNLFYSQSCERLSLEVEEKVEKVVYLDVDCSNTSRNRPSRKVKDCNFLKRKSPNLYLYKGDASSEIFGHLHNPASPSKYNILLYDKKEFTDFNTSCESVYLTRTGSRANQPNKCVALVKVSRQDASLQQHSHRVGYTALLTNQYQADYARQPRCYNEEKLLLPPLLSHLDTLDIEFKRKMGNPISDNNKRRTAIIMVANDGVMDLLLNFLCSLHQVPSISPKDILVYVSSSGNVPLIENMGANAIYHEALGSMPKHAAGGYLDKTFSRMMWFKTTSVYLAIRNGFNVLFQDVDLVWIKDPIRYFEKLHSGYPIRNKNEKGNLVISGTGIKYDVSFMDDGARTPRYTPFFVNSGFYYVQYNNRTKYFQEKMMKCSASEIGYSHSHQSVMIKHLAETHHLSGMQIYVLDRDLFPSGQAYHERKKYIQKITEQKYRPFVFHMCWTSNRVDKVKYFKEMKLWYVSDSIKVCANPSAGKRISENRDIKELCCSRSNAWVPEAINENAKE